MSTQIRVDVPFFPPRPGKDDLMTIFFLWRLSREVVITDKGCWEWQGAKTRHGYGIIGLTGKLHRVHRIIYDLCVSEVPEGLYVLHECDNPSCCNPAHLFVGTQADNVHDCMAKGRLTPRSLPAGEKNPHAKFTDDEIREIRRRAATGERGIITQLAKEKGVLRNTISRIVHRRSWNHIPGDVTQQPDDNSTGE